MSTIVKRQREDVNMMGNQRWAWVGMTAVGLLLARPAPAQTPAEVNRAIERGLEYLKSMQRGDGWPDVSENVGGMTALVVLALLSCDLQPDDPIVARAIKSLMTLKTDRTYTVALQTMALVEAKPTGYFPIVKRNAEWLMKERVDAFGAWGYPRGPSQWDNSNTQFALLGLQAAAEAGVVIPEKFWDECRRHWLNGQSAQGSWGYTGQGAMGSMTVAGIASLVITNRNIEVMHGQVDGMPVRCNGVKEDAALEKGIGWVARNFSVSNHPNGAQQWLYYYLYGMERAGRMTGRRFFGDFDWYRRGVQFLIAKQRPDGSWESGGSTEITISNTAFGLLFLSKGRIPIIINKLKYAGKEQWNKSPHNVSNLTEYMTNIWKKKVNWQVVDIELATVEDLMQAPIVQFSGHHPPEFSPRAKKVLKEYVEQGGVIFADANCGVPQFDAGFRQLCAELFPDNDLRPLEPGHGVWTSLFDLSKVAEAFPLHGIDVGCRTAVLYSPVDLSCQWQHKKDLEEPSSPAHAIFRIGANMISYVTGPENLMDKLEERKVFKDGPEDNIQRNFLQVAKIKHNGDWNPAPRAIKNLMSQLRELIKIDVVRQQREIDLLDPNLVNYPLCYMHGRTRFVMTKSEKDQLGEHLKRGAVLFADACCGSESFDEAFRGLVQEMLGAKLEPIPTEHELFTEATGYDLKKVTFNKSLGNREGAPVFEGVKHNDRYVVIYSKYDLGCAMERQQGSDCKGYSHESAMRLATNIVLYSLKQ